MARKQNRVSGLRLAVLRITGWFCILLGVCALVRLVWLYFQLLGSISPAVLAGMPGGPFQQVSLLVGPVAPFALGFLLIELARVHDRLNRQADDIEALGWRDPV